MTLIVEKRGAVGWIVFNQPAKKNAINGAMWRGIPKAMAEAFQSGRLGIIDYYELRNVQADTEMRKSIALSSSGTNK
jgi:uncharacterized protein YqfA (UPF0365 family)